MCPGRASLFDSAPLSIEFARARPFESAVVYVEEVLVGRSPYQSEKRRKEIARLKKQEEKRQRRFNKKHEGETPEGQVEGVALEGGIESGEHPAENAQDESGPAGQTVAETPDTAGGTGTPS